MSVRINRATVPSQEFARHADDGRRVEFVLADGNAHELRISRGAGRYALEWVAP